MAARVRAPTTRQTECETWSLTAEPGAKSVPGCRSCQQKNPSAWRSWGCLCSSWCGLAAGRASGRRSPRRTQWTRRPGSESLDWTWNKEDRISDVARPAAFIHIVLYYSASIHHYLISCIGERRSLFFPQILSETTNSMMNSPFFMPMATMSPSGL